MIGALLPLLALLVMPLAAAAPRTWATVVPGYRFSTQVRPEARVCSEARAACDISLLRNGKTLRTFPGLDLAPGEEVHRDLDLRGAEGNLCLRFRFLDPAGRELGRRDWPIQVVAGKERSTRRLDGCWISLRHWSDDEGQRFNAALEALDGPGWAAQIRGMARAGIRQVIVQNVFESDAYAGRHTMTASGYLGRAYYPSGLWPARRALGCADPLEAILAAADAEGMHVFLGVGLFAWFDFSPASLAWHEAVTRELATRYGGHPSLYGWYVSEEIFGNLYGDGAFLPPSRNGDLETFFRDYRAFVRGLTPTLPVALAPNNDRFGSCAQAWGRILPFVDILIPFGFARMEDPTNLPEIAALCARAGTRFWVDMEMFAWPIEGGLAPKSGDGLVREIRRYDAVEQIFGYQFTGLMNPPDGPEGLGGGPARKLYEAYLAYAGSLPGGTR
jgi:hypothetical protein